MKSRQVEVTSFIDTSYKEYSKYVLFSRAIPHLIDGLKPSQRKILYTAIMEAKGFLKTASLSGSVIAKASYHHGDASLNAAINSMVQDFNNNLPLLEGKGSFGSRLIPEAAAARYTNVKISKNYSKYFLDNDILPENVDMEDPEPLYYLPIIPWVLVNGVRGIAVGFATEIQPRDPKLLIKVCKDYLNGKNIDKVDLPPYYNGFKGKIFKNEAGWACEGSYTLSGTTLRITEVPIGFTREKYVEILEKLKEKGHIVSYQDSCSKDGFDFSVTLKRGKKLTDDKIIMLFRLQKQLNENLTVINEKGDLEVFENPIDIVKRFCDHRLTMYKKRFEHYIDKATKEKELLAEKASFILLVVNGKITMKNKTSKQLRQDVIAQGYKFVDELLRIPFYNFSKDYMEDCSNKISDLADRIKVWKKIDLKQAFTLDLSDI